MQRGHTTDTNKLLRQILAESTSLQREVTSLKRELGATAKAQGALLEVASFSNLPYELRGCRQRVLLVTDADLDDLVGKGTATAVLEALLCSREGAEQVLRRLLLAVKEELTASVLSDNTAVEELKVQLQQAAEDHHPNVAHTQLLVQQARDLLQAAGLLVDEDSLHWNAASSLLELISSSSGGGSGSGSGSSSGSRHQPSPSLLLLFLMTVGRLRVDLDLDLVRLEPVPFGKPRLTVGAMRTDVAGVSQARRHLATAVAVLELAYHCSRRRTQNLLSALWRRDTWERPSLDAQAYVCGVINGGALAARKDLLEDLQVQLAGPEVLSPVQQGAGQQPGAPGTVLLVPLKAYRIGDQDPLIPFNDD